MNVTMVVGYKAENPDLGIPKFGLCSESYSIWSNNMTEWIGEYKNEYGYDENGFINLHQYYRGIDDNNKWIKCEKMEYLNNNFGNPIIAESSKWDESLGVFIPAYKHEYHYFDNGKLESDLYTRWLQDSLRHQNIYKTEVTLDITENDSLLIMWDWNDVNHSWRKYIKEEKVYSELSNDSTSTIYDYINNKWVYYSKEIIAFEKKKIDVCYEHYLYSNRATDSAIWVGELKKESNYESNGNLSLEITYKWDREMANWVKNTKRVFTYNIYEKLQDKFGYCFDTISNDWICDWIANYTYDDLGHETILMNSYLNSSLNEWVIYKRFNYYSENVIDIVDRDIISQVMIFPNPSSNSVNIVMPLDCGNSCFLYNSKGQLIKELYVKEGINTIKIEHLIKGLYFIRVPNPNGFLIKKLIKA